MHTVIITADFYNLLPFSISETSLHIPTGRFVHHHLLHREHYEDVCLLCNTTPPERGWS